MKKRKGLLINLLVSLVTLVICLAIAEAFFRIKDNQPLLGELELLRSPIDPKLKEKAEWLSLRLAKEKLTDPALLSLYSGEPEKRKYGSTRNETKLLMKEAILDPGGNKGFNIVRVWNKNFIRDAYCNGNGLYSKDMIPPGSFLYAFEGPDSSVYPIFRFFPNNAMSKFRSNDFGWGGDSVSFIKPKNTIRIAFLGASTTQQRGGCDFAYPDYVGEWLNEWAKAEKIPVKFEIINSGRAGLISMDFLAIMKYELVPVEPDITVYYEGRNQMAPEEISCICEADKNITFSLLKRFALFRKVIELTGYDILKNVENSKGVNNMRILRKLNIAAPDITSPLLPLNLPQILADIDSIRLLNERIKSTFILCSYGMFTDERMLTNGLKYASVYSYWMNQFPGFRLKDIALLNELENRTFKAYCDKNNVPFIDVAKELTRLSEAFDDGIHLKCEGMKYHAWIVFLELLPVIEERLKNGTLPRPSTQKLTSHPYIKYSFERVTLPFPCN